MVVPSIKEQIIQALEQMNEQEQEEVLEFIHNDILPPGTPGEVLIGLARELNFDPEDLRLMEQAIEEEYERIED